MVRTIIANSKGLSLFLNRAYNAYKKDETEYGFVIDCKDDHLTCPMQINDGGLYVTSEGDFNISLTERQICRFTSILNCIEEQPISIKFDTLTDSVLIKAEI